MPTGYQSREAFAVKRISDKVISFQANQRPPPKSLTHEPSNTVFVQSVDNNPVGQWIACQRTSASPLSIIVLPKYCCLCCIFKATTSHFDICIISGRLKDQPAKESKSHHGIQLPAKVGVFRVPGKNLPEGVEKENRPETLSPDRSKSRQRLHRAPVMVTEPSKNDRKPRTGLRPKVAISIVKNLDLPSHHYIFFTILSFILKWVYIFRYFN